MAKKNENEGEFFQDINFNGDMRIHKMPLESFSEEKYTIYGTTFVSRNICDSLIIEAQDFYYYYGKEYDSYDELLEVFKGELLSTYLEYNGERYEPSDREIETAFTIATKMKYMRKKSGLSQEDMSKKFGIPKRTIQNWENCINICPQYELESIILQLAMSNTETMAIAKLYLKCDLNQNSIFEDIKRKYLRKIIGKEGREIIWYKDDSNNTAIYVDTEEFLTEQEISKL